MTKTRLQTLVTHTQPHTPTHTCVCHGPSCWPNPSLLFPMISLIPSVHPLSHPTVTAASLGQPHTPPGQLMIPCWRFWGPQDTEEKVPSGSCPTCTEQPIKGRRAKSQVGFPTGCCVSCSHQPRFGDNFSEICLRRLSHRQGIPLNVFQHMQGLLIASGVLFFPKFISKSAVLPMTCWRKAIWLNEDLFALTSSFCFF